jgi:hypothetical protein
MKKQRVLASVLSVWGTAVVLRAIIVGFHGTGGYRSGEVAAMIFGAAMIAFGLRAYRRNMLKELVPPRATDASEDHPSHGQ